MRNHKHSIKQFTTGSNSSVVRLVSLAAAGQARAFEVLPAVLARDGVPLPETVKKLSPVEQQLLAAAADLANEVQPSKALVQLLSILSERKSEDIFAFSGNLFPWERLVASTTPVLRSHNVFCACDQESFLRHFR